MLGEGLLAFIIGLYTIKSVKKEAEARAEQAKADAEKAKVEADTAMLQPLRDTIEVLSNQLRESNERENAKDELIAHIREEKDSLHEQLIEKTEENATIKQLLCVHGGCVVRKPIRGRGDNWYDTYKNDPSLGIDSLPINQLLREYGKIKEQVVKEAITENYNTESYGQDND